MASMLPPNDYVRAARYLIERNGHKAQVRAEARAEVLQVEGNRTGQMIWMLLARTIAEMTGARQPPEPKGNFFDRTSTGG